MKMGLRNLRRRKARTALTVVGVVIGTISIIVMISLGVGLNYCYEKTMMEYGSINTLTIQQNAYVENEEGDGEGREVDQKGMMNDEFVETLRQIKHIKTVTPVFESYLSVYGNGWMTDCNVRAVDFSVLDKLEPLKPVMGTYDFTAGTSQMVIGAGVFEYRYRMPNYKEVTSEFDITKEKLSFVFQDLGYYEDNGSTETEENPVYTEPQQILPPKEHIKDFVFVNDPDKYEYNYSITMDISYFKKLYEKQAKKMPPIEKKRVLKKIDQYSGIMVIVDNVKNISAVTEQIRDLGAQANGLGTYIDQVKEEAKMIELVLGGIGAVAMLVSAISIANTMIMSIYERTKEIGIMKVLGCVVTDIKRLFLLEAGIIGAIGGVIGIGCSYLLSYVVNRYGGPSIGSAMGMDTSGDEMLKISLIPAWLPLLALLFAFLIGIISGYFPARRATKISAIEAMKSEG